MIETSDWLSAISQVTNDPNDNYYPSIIQIPSSSDMYCSYTRATETQKNVYLESSPYLDLPDPDNEWKSWIGNPFKVTPDQIDGCASVLLLDENERIMVVYEGTNIEKANQDLGFGQKSINPFSPDSKLRLYVGVDMGPGGTEEKIIYTGYIEGKPVANEGGYPSLACSTTDDMRYFRYSVEGAYANMKLEQAILDIATQVGINAVSADFEDTGVTLDPTGVSFNLIDTKDGFEALQTLVDLAPERYVLYCDEEGMMHGKIITGSADKDYDLITSKKIAPDNSYTDIYRKVLVWAMKPQATGDIANISGANADEELMSALIETIDPGITAVISPLKIYKEEAPEGINTQADLEAFGRKRLAEVNKRIIDVTCDVIFPFIFRPGHIVYINDSLTNLNGNFVVVSVKGGYQGSPSTPQGEIRLKKEAF